MCRRGLRVRVLHRGSYACTADDSAYATFQLEGGIVHAASMTLKEQVTLDGDGITSLDWDRYPIMTFSEVPEIT